MHPGHVFASTLKRGRPIGGPVIGGSLGSSSPLLTTRKPSTDHKRFANSIATTKAKSPLSEIRRRELMLAKDVLPYDLTTRPHLIHPASQVLALPTRIQMPSPHQREGVSGLSKSVIQPDEGTINQELPPTLLDRGFGVQGHLIHPASQVLALPSHLQLTQHEGAAASSSNTIIPEPILIDDTPHVNVMDNDAIEHLTSGRLDTPPLLAEESSLAKQQYLLSKNTTNDGMETHHQNLSPVIAIADAAHQSRSDSPEVIPIDSPLEESPANPRESEVQDPRFTHHIVGDGFTVSPPHLNHAVTTSVISTVLSPTIPHHSASNAEMTSQPPQVAATTTHAKVNPGQPLVLEIENSSIGLYLHLDLSKYLCEKARDFLVEHVMHECKGTCRANFPLHTSQVGTSVSNAASSTTMSASSIQTEAVALPDSTPMMSAHTTMDTNFQQQTFLPTTHTPIHISNRVSTISKAPPVSTNNHTRAFPTAILAVPQHTECSEDRNRGLCPKEDFLTKLQNSTDVSNTNVLASSEVNSVVNNIAPSSSIPTVLSTEQLPRNGNMLPPRTNRRKANLMNAMHHRAAGENSQVENSLIFQRWPSLKQFMQVRCLAGNSKEYSCYKCGKQFTQMHQLKVHVKNHIKRYNCQQCHYSTHRMANLRRHQLTHRQFTDLTCHACNAVMANKRAYTLHVLFAHKRPRKLPIKSLEQWKAQQLVESAKNAMPGTEGDKADDTQQASSGGPVVTENYDVNQFQPGKKGNVL